jgi:hypothetical protein
MIEACLVAIVVGHGLGAEGSQVEARIGGAVKDRATTGTTFDEGGVREVDLCC